MKCLLTAMNKKIIFKLLYRQQDQSIGLRYVVNNNITYLSCKWQLSCTIININLKSCQENILIDR